MLMCIYPDIFLYGPQLSTALSSRHLPWSHPGGQLQRTVLLEPDRGAAVHMECVHGSLTLAQSVVLGIFLFFFFFYVEDPVNLK